MSRERPQPPLLERGFGFTENEKLFTLLNDERFKQIVFDAQTTIHKMGVDSNSYGEFLFTTISRAGQQGREVITLYGCGYHEHRDRWFQDEWYWHRSNSHSSLLKQKLTAEEAKERLEERQSEIAPLVARHQQSRQGQLFELFAELTDDDGMIAEMEDFPDLFDDLE